MVIRLPQGIIAHQSDVDVKKNNRDNIQYEKNQHQNYGHRSIV